jgi:hypothetical protein
MSRKVISRRYDAFLVYLLRDPLIPWECAFEEL